MPPKGFRVGVEQRFWSKVDKRGDGECWEWTANRHQKGYGTMRVERKVLKAHRISYELHHGPVPDGLHVLHRCDNPPCVNPAHLWAGTNAENVADKEAKGRGGQPKGSKHHGATLTEEQVIMMRRLHEGGMKQKDLVTQFGVEKSRVSAIIRRRIWRHV